MSPPGLCSVPALRPESEPEDLLQAKIVDATPHAREMGITVGMTGKDAVELIGRDQSLHCRLTVENPLQKLPRPSRPQTSPS